MNTITPKIRLAMNPSALALSIALACVQPALAQDNNTSTREESTSGADQLLETIFVTATKKAGGERLQATNVSINAFGEQQLEAFAVRDISNLSFKTPNVSLDDIGTARGTANFAIRGLGVNSSIPSIDPAVGVFVDGVYLGINSGVIFDTFDLEAVEVLRGPQGVLFGRNVTGGAVVMRTADPTDELTIKAKGAIESGFRGTGSNMYLQGVISGPIVEDKLSAKIGVYYNDDNGWFENLFNGVGGTNAPLPTSIGAAAQGLGEGENFGRAETTIVRGAIKWTPTDTLTFVAKLEYGDTEGDGPAGQSHVNGSGAPSFATVFTGNPAFTFDRNSFDLAINEPGFNAAEWTQFSLRTDFDVSFGDGTITNIFGYRDFEQSVRSDIDATVLTVFHAETSTAQDQISNELRYNGRFFDDRLDVTAGVFYFEQDLQYEEGREVQSALFFDGGGILEHQTIGVFASGDYAITDKLTVTAGVRFNNEKRDAQIAQISLSNAPCAIFTEGTACPLGDFDDINTSNWSPKIGLAYAIQDNMRVYGHWSRAFRAGSYNLRNTAIDVTDPLQRPGPFEDERVDTFEIGFKSEPKKGARFNLAFFYSDVNNLQREINIDGGTAVVQQIINNSANAEIYGAELDIQWPVFDNLVFNGSLGWTEGNYTDVLINLTAPIDGSFNVPPGPDDLALEIPRLIPFTANVGLTYFQDTPVGEATVNFSYAYRDRTFYTDNNLGFTNEQNRVDFSMALDVQDTGLNVMLYGRNLTNAVLHGNDTQLSAGTFAPLSRGRVLGIEFTYKY